MSSLSSEEPQPTNPSLCLSQNRRIQPLPKEVVDQIAAGEVVQRAASVVKELMENSLDAESTNILVHYESTKLQVIDNGCGICPQDLQLAATRFATSKFSSTNDFDTLSTFGFRGEALASMNLVAKLELISRQRQQQQQQHPQNAHANHQHPPPTTLSTATAFSQSYLLGKPIHASPKPTARLPGTTVTVSDLFYNLPHRQKTLLDSRSSLEEYNKVLQVVQAYSIHYPHVSFVCRRKRCNAQSDRGKGGGEIIMDLNTGALSAVKELQRQRQQMQQTVPLDIAENKAPLNTLLESWIDSARRQVLGVLFRQCTMHKFQVDKPGQCQVQGLISDPSSSSAAASSSADNQKTQFVLICNNRWVESNLLKKSLERLYQEFASNSKKSHMKPIFYISIHVDPKEVDVNVHPTKKQVTLLHQDLIYDSILAAVRTALEGLGRTISSLSSSVPSTPRPVVIKHGETETTTQDAATMTPLVVTNPYASKRKRTNQVDNEDSSVHGAPNSHRTIPNKIVKTNLPKDKIRTSTAAPAGAMEPFVMSQRTRPLSSSGSSTTSSILTDTSSPNKDTSTITPTAIIHEAACPFSSPLDMTSPGAFAQRCTCVSVVRIARSPTVCKVPKIVTTECTYKSIQSLRHAILVKQVDEEWQRRLRKEAIFIGLLGEQKQRCLVQCGAELQEWDLASMAQRLFQQLALQQFGGMSQAYLGASVDIARAVGQLLELEDALLTSTVSSGKSLAAKDDSQKHCDVETLQTSPASVAMNIKIKKESTDMTVSEAHLSLAHQVATCLLDRAEMLEEYFSIGIERQKDGIIVVTTLPVILPQYIPNPSGLSLFLLRLATEVNWEEEKPCFWQISKELGLFYGSMMKEDCLQHMIFPAVCQLLVPPTKSGYFHTLTNLSILYKAFERG